MVLIENLVYWLHFGPCRRAFRYLCLTSSIGSRRVVLGQMRGCRCGEYCELAHRLGIYEIHVQRALLQALTPGAVFYDVGANVGYFSLLGARLVGEKGRVFAFEPSVDCSLRLEQFCADNRICNIVAVTYAVSATVGEGFLESASSHSQSHLAGSHGRVGRRARTTTLDAFVVENPPPDVVLMDIEGAEMEALSGAEALLRSPRGPVWIIEAHDREKVAAVEAKLASHGYTVTRLRPPLLRSSGYPLHLLACKSGSPM